MKHFIRFNSGDATYFINLDFVSHIAIYNDSNPYHRVITVYGTAGVIFKISEKEVGSVKILNLLHEALLREIIFPSNNPQKNVIDVNRLIALIISNT